MLIQKPKDSDTKPSEITSETIYQNRRGFIRSMGFIGATALLGNSACAKEPPQKLGDLGDIEKSNYSTNETSNSYEDITQYNNFYEFGTGKQDPYMNSSAFKPKPWSV